ncbi:MAG: hypothetical protein ABIO79_13495 [Ferruginibacter sp.]
MKKIKIFFTAAIFLSALITIAAFKPLPAGPSANGQGTLTIPGDITRHFSFHVNTMPGGGVQGNGVLTYTGGVQKIMFDINCMTIVGNIAYMSGIVTHWPSAPENVGISCFFQVMDNGQGSGSSADRMSLLYFGGSLPIECVDQEVGMSPIEGGNIQVKN